MFVMPFVEQMAVYNAINFSGGPTVAGEGVLRYGGATNTTVSRGIYTVFTCPSDGTGMTFSNLTYHNYAVNYGNTSLDQRPTLNGVQFGGAPFTSLLPNDTSVLGYLANSVSGNLSSIASIRDGTSNTLLAAEVVKGEGGDLRGFTWWGPASTFQTYLQPNSTLPDVPVRAGYCIYPHPRNPPCFGEQTAAQPSMFASRSRHPGGVNTAFGDGSVRFIKNTVQLGVWRSLGTTAGGEVVSADAF